MSAWHYIEEDGNPKESGYYEVALEQCVTYADQIWTDEPDEMNKIVPYDSEPHIGICFWSNRDKKWIYSNSFRIGGDESQLCDLDHIYAWVDVLLNAPKMIYPSRKIEINPAKYHLTEAQLMSFLDDYKLSFEGGYTK